MNNNEYWKNVIDYCRKNIDQDDIYKYIFDVIDKKITASKYIIYICKRQLLWWYKWKNEQDFPFEYNSKQVKIACAFFQLQLVPETKKPYILPPYRKFMLSIIFGWYYKNNPSKMVTREIYDVEARKQGKSTFMCILALYVSIGALKDNFPAVFFCGVQKESSKILYDISSRLITINPAIRSLFIKNNSVNILSKNQGIIRKLSFEKGQIEGQNPTLGILTEFHLHPDLRMQESLTTAVNESRINQLIVYDTTKGVNLNLPWYSFEIRYKKFLEYQIANPQKLTDNYDIALFAYELDVDDYDNWKNPELWIKANPNMNLTISLESLKAEFNKIDSRVQEIEFQTKRLGMAVNQANAYFDLMELLESDKKNENIYKEYFIDSDKYKNLKCIIGVDLSMTTDTTAVVEQYDIPQDDGESIWLFKHKGFIPSKTALEKETKDRVPYQDWQRKGWVNIIEGNVIDYNIVADYISTITKNCNVALLGYDRWNFSFIQKTILEKSILSEKQLVDTKQNVYLTPAFREFERKLKLKKVCFCGNEMLINHFLNISMKPKNNDYLYPEKVSQNERIDGAIASMTAAANRKDVDSKNSNYEYYFIDQK